MSRKKRFTRVTTLGAIMLVVAVSLLACQAPQAAPAAPTTAPATKATQAPAAPAATTQAPAAAAPVGTTQAPAATTAPAATPQETLKIGIILPMTGPVARNGIISERFMRMGIDDVNAKGGIKVGGKSYRFEAVTADDKFTSDGGRDAANRLVLSEKVKYILGSVSGTTPGVQIVTEPNNVLVMASSPVDGALGEKFPLTFAVGMSHERTRGPVAFDWLVKAHPTAKKVAVLLADDPSGHTIGPIAKDAATQRGLTVLSEDYFASSTKDFGPVVARVLEKNPDAIYIGSTPSYSAVFLGLAKALSEQNFKKPWFGSTASVGTLQQAGPIANGFAFTQPGDYASPLIPAAVKGVVERYIKQFGQSEFELTSPLIYMDAQVLAQAIEKAGGVDDPQKVAKAMRGGEFDTIWGKATFGGQKTFGIASYISSPVFISQVQEGKIVTSDVFPGLLP